MSLETSVVSSNVPSRKNKVQGHGRFYIKVLLVSGMIGILLFGALHTDLLSLVKVPDLINRVFMTYAESYVDKPLSQTISILTIESDPTKNGGLGQFGPNWRGYHSQVVDSLSEAGAYVIAFDMYFEDSSPEHDDEFGKAIKRANERGTKVVLGVRDYRSKDGNWLPKLNATLEKYVDRSNWALLEVGGRTRDSPLIRKLRLAADPSGELPDWIVTDEYPIVPSFPLQLSMHYWGGKDQTSCVYKKDQGALEIQASGSRSLRSIPVDNDLDFIFVIADSSDLDKISIPYTEVLLHQLQNKEYLRSQFSGKIVIVGVRTFDDLRAISNNDKRYGFEILASATSNLLQNSFIRRAASGYQFVVLLLMCFCGALFATRLNRWLSYSIPIKVPNFIDVKVDLPLSIILVGGAFVLSAFFVYVKSRITLDITYHLVGLVLTFYVVRALFKKR